MSKQDKIALSFSGMAASCQDKFWRTIEENCMIPEDELIKALGILSRREIEARVIVPIVDAFSQEFGRESTLEILSCTIKQIANQQGIQLAKNMGGNSIRDFARALDAWKKDDALRIEMIEQDDSRLYFNVVRCRYAELYEKLGISELGVILSCNRDQALIEGFNPNIKFERSQTIMEGAKLCDFRYRMERE